MSTSLAEQLRRLATPQTSILDQRDKKKPSLLFDPKEAATFERATVLDIGRSGLKDLIKINPKFEIFETTIFSQSSLRFERAVQTQKDNDQLNDIIRNFLHLISPHFLLKPAQQALEWLINRYRIHEYNRNDFIALILPYHETNIFIRCLRLLDISKSSDPWHWMYKTQKANVVLGKSLVLNHCASNISFMKFICRDIAAKTKVHGSEAKLLVAEYSFYCTTIMGALEYSKTISEEQVSTILPSLLGGMASNVNDYVSSTYMILALLLVKTKLKYNLIEKFLSKLANVSIADIQAKSCLLIVLIYQTQDLKTFPEFALKTLSMQTWFLQYLKELASSGVELTSLIIAFCTGAIQYLQKNDSSEGKTKVVEFVITMLKAIILDEMGSELLLRTSLETYNAKKDESTMNSWYCTFLKELHSIYPETYKKIITLSYNEENSLNSKQKQTLEKVMKSEMSEVILSKTAFSIFDKLCHHDVNQRVDAIRYLTQNYFKMSLKDQEFLKPQLIQRFEDENTKVIDSLLEFSNTSLIELLGSDLYTKLIEILSTVSSIRIKERILAILTSGQIEIQSETHLFITILPFLFPNNDDELKLLSKVILPSKFAKKHPILVRNNKLAVQAKNNSPEEFCKISSQEIFSSKNQTGDISKILEVIEILNEKNQIFQITLALAYMNSSIPDNCTRENLCKILKLLSKLNLNAKRIKSSGNLFNLIESARKNILPDELIILCIETVLEKSVFNLEFKLYDLTTNSELTNLLPCFEMIISGKLFKDGVNDSNYKSIVDKFFNKISSEVKNQLIILSNFFSVPQSIVDKELQMAALTITNDIITKNSDKIEWLNNFSPDNNFIISVLFLFMSQDSEIRKSSMNVLENIHQLLTKEKKGFSFLINSLLNRQSEIMLDHEQLPMILYTILSPDLSVQKSLTKSDKENSKNILNHLLTLSVKQDYPVYVTSSLFKMLSLINSKEILDQLSLVAYNLLKKNEEIQIFNVFQSEIMLAIISKINSDTIDNISIKNNSNIWGLITIMFEKFRVKYILNNKNHYCLELLLDTFDKDVFERLPEDGQVELICSIINLATNLDISEIRSAITKFFKRIELNASFFRSIFEQMHEVTVQNETKKSRRISVIPKIDTLDKTEWKCGITALEFLQNKKKLHNVHLILPILFDILKKCLDFEEQASLEYPKQLILSCILNCSQKLSPQATKWTQKHLLPESAFNIELIVQCIRATQNPQTHHHALLLLSHISGMFPEQVLHHIVAIFTFMGSSVLRHDDAYSFQIITKIIDIIIPILVNNENQKQDTSFERIIPILRVFVDVLVDVPVHRRVPLFEKLLITFGEKNSLWIFLALVFESHVLHAHETQPVQTKHSLVSNELPKRLEIANSIISQFAPDIILFTCIQLIDYLKNLPIDNETNKTIDRFFGIEKRTPKEFRHFKYTIVTSVLTILGAPSLIRNIALLPDDKSQNLEPLYRKFIITILSYIHSVSKCAEEYNGKPQAKYWKVMLHHCFDILDNINSLLTSDMFLLVVRGLMSHNLPAVRRKAMELLNSKLQLQNDFITETTDNENLFNLIEPLMRVIVTIDKKSSQETEEELNQQTALFSLKLLAKRLATNNPEKFRPILDQVVALLKVKKIQDNVLASLILCFAELCNNLRVHSLYSLNKFMPVILKILNTQKMKKQPDLVLLSTVTAVQKILDTLPLFLNPFLEKIITDISILCSKWCIEDSSQPVNPKNDPLITKLKSIVQKIAQTIPHRVLIPAIAQSYGKLIALDQLPAIAYAMNILAESIKVLDGSNLKTVQIELSDFFLSALQFRSDNVENDIEENQISLVEGHTVNALVSLVLKLSESSFKPLYFKIFDWATREENSEHKTRAITFYRVSRDIADNLKGLFVLFAGHFLKNAASLLDKCNNFKSEQLFFEMDEEKCCILVNYILQTLNYVFLYDNQNFINNDRFELLMQSIVDQLENTIGGEDKLKYRIDNILVECIGHFAVATADDSLWKQLNYQVLLKTRHNLPLVRLAGLKTLCEMAKKLGEDFLPLLPETIPFLSELLEDEDEAVEAACKNAVQELEKVLGEPLQKYF